MRRYNPSNSKISVDENGKVFFTEEEQKLSEKDMTAISSWKKKIKKVKGLTKQQMQLLQTLPTPVITALINQVGMVVADTEKDKPEIKESPLVASNLDIVSSIIDKIHDDIKKLFIKKQGEKAWPKVQALAKMAGYKVTKQAQAKGKIFRYDIKK